MKLNLEMLFIKLGNSQCYPFKSSFPVKSPDTSTCSRDSGSLPSGSFIQVHSSRLSFFFSPALSLPLCWKSRAVKLSRKHQSCLHLPPASPPPPHHHHNLHPGRLSGCYQSECLLCWVNPCILMGEASEADRVP